MKFLKMAKPTGGDKRERRKEQKSREEKRQQMKVLVKYIDKDYAQTKER